ncbi:hypothetical protein [Aliikangiella maris]|uniref:Uncharacterized protein n=2 Tax=Aliikangiella maris TaxID=3162458 RepID=A0ABV2BYK4_9GAMM
MIYKIVKSWFNGWGEFVYFKEKSMAMHKSIISLVEFSNTVANNLPKGWVFQLGDENTTAYINGPNKASILLTKKASEALLVGAWPNDPNGRAMDPYSWGVLKITSPYPFKRINLEEQPELLTKEVLSFIDDYQPIYCKCLDKCAHKNLIAV